MQLKCVNVRVFITKEIEKRGLGEITNSTGFNVVIFVGLPDSIKGYSYENDSG
jgi:hypothetical protein